VAHEKREKKTGKSRSLSSFYSPGRALLRTILYEGGRVEANRNTTYKVIDVERNYLYRRVE